MALTKYAYGILTSKNVNKILKFNTGIDKKYSKSFEM